MLDAETKRRIDTARDILVGKVPDPKSQVEQITIALIYKFMDDIDSQSEVMGGKRSFFAGDFARYGWARLMRSGLGGHEVLSLYAEAITRMPENPGIPPLFRDIFNNAYLPYRDPETLRAFLKVIDEFEYDHSERLGDAFEYLLSVMGAQGDAGQFRTPRHVIDFIVAVIDPKKHETVLDPACGTAGFLISSYKHILAANTDADGQSTLTPDEKGRLAGGFSGYDISPDMVRLSLVNMYLHGFADPHIQEYDTLTSEDRWNEYADVILANPPFMSPKGGIRPHNRFSVKSRRSEVLFVDYMAEHLTPSGRAGIIVPEGIIFQSQRAHTQLRKMLVEEFLVAVVSLPAGVFKPYSGVKTSILILDRALARRTDRIAFFKVENDGFDLGDQRRPIDKNDLPQTAEALKQYLNMDGQDIQDGEIKSSSSCPSMLDDLIRQGTALLVPKEKIAADGDYNLNGERYRAAISVQTEWPMVRLDELSQINPDTINPDLAYPDQTIFYIDISSVENGTGHFLGYSEVLSSAAPSRARRSVRNGDVLLSTVRPNLKAFTHLDRVHERAIASTGFAVIRAIRGVADPKFIHALIRSDHVVSQMIGMMEKGSYPSINQSDVASLMIPLPPLEVQREIVAEIEGYQKVIDGARAVIANYRPYIPIDPEWPMVRLAESCQINPDKVIPASVYPDQTIFYIDISSVENETGRFLGYTEVLSSEAPSRARRGVHNDDVLLSTVRPNLKAFTLLKTVKERAIASTGFAVLRALPAVANAAFIHASISSDDSVSQMIVMMEKSSYPSINQSDVASIRIALPPLALQQEIADGIEAEETLVNANCELIKRFEQKIRAAIDRVWGDG